MSTKASSATWPSTATGNDQHGLSVFAFTGRSDRAGGAESEATGDLRSYSGHGPRVDGANLLGIAAPDNPSTTWPASANEVGPAGYGSFNGTSGAGPHVAGALALLVQAGWSANAGLSLLVQHTQIDDQVEAGPAQAWGSGKLRLDLALSRSLEPLSDSFEPPEYDEPGPFALVSPPTNGIQRLRLSTQNPWLDWRNQPMFIDGASEPVEVEWINQEGRRGRYLLELTTPSQNSESEDLTAPLGQVISPRRAQPPPAELKPLSDPLSGALPQSAGCHSIPASLWLGLIVLGLRRRR